MQTTSRLFDDLARVAGGAASSLAGVKDELDNLVRSQLERLLEGMELVTRDEFEAVKALAANARAEQEKLEKRVAELEAQAKPKAKRTRRAAKAAPADPDA